MNKFWVGALSLAVASTGFAVEEPKSNASHDWKIEVAKPKAGEKPTWGVSVGAYFPTGDEIKNIFGDTLVRFGFSPVSRKFDKKWDITTDVNVLVANENGAKLFVLPFTVGASMGFGEENVKWYVAVNAGPAYYDYRLFRLVDVDGKPSLIEFRDKTFGWNANVEGGLLFNKRLSVTARYDWFKKADDFDFNGFSVNVNYAFFKW